jgi:folate-binding protein YgfZ
VAGPDAAGYLQGQLSQDVAALAPGGWAWALVLQPQGKLDAFVRVTRTGTDEFLLDTDTAVADHLVERLNRFKLRTKAEVERLPWEGLAVRGRIGDAAGDLELPGGPQPVAEALAEGGGMSVPFQWDAWLGYDLFGPKPELPAGVASGSVECYELARVAAGFPCHGTELDESTIPAEAGLVAACVSFSKGCYTGQELVARIDYRGSNVPRNLRGLELSGPASASAVLRSPGDASAPAKEVGRLTTVVGSDERGWWALGYVGRGVGAGARLDVLGSSGGDVIASALVRPLPMALRRAAAPEP